MGWWLRSQEARCDIFHRAHAIVFFCNNHGNCFITLLTVLVSKTLGYQCFTNILTIIITHYYFYSCIFGMVGSERQLNFYSSKNQIIITFLISYTNGAVWNVAKRFKKKSCNINNNNIYFVSWIIFEDWTPVI